MSLRRRPLLQAALAAPAFLSAASRRAMAQDPRRLLRSVPIGDLRALDPIWTTTYLTRNHAYLVWDTLFALDAENRPQPQMVEAWETSGGGLTWTFRLREGLLWHDDTPVTGADCAASIRRWGARDGMGRALMAVTEALDAPDARTIRLKLKRPVGFVLDALGKIDSNVPFMMPERLARTDPTQQIAEVIGSGPFRFDRSAWVPGIKVVYDRFARYVPRSEPPSQAAGGKLAKLDRIESVYTPDSATAANGLITGELDLLESPAPDLVQHLQRARDVVVASNDPLGYQLFVVFNHLHPPFDKVAARRALMSVIRQSDFMQATVGDRSPSRECAAVFGCAAGEDAQFDALGWPRQDLATAQRQFRNSGYDGRPIVVMDPADNATLHPGALLLADALRRLGVTLDLVAMDWSALVSRRASRAAPAEGGWNCFVTNATITGISNPLLNTFVRNCEDAWFGWPCDRRVPELTEAWTFESDPAKRQEILKRLERVHLENATQVPLGQYRSVIAHRRNLRGLINAPALFYWNIEKA
ncbi:ABC transporter substrate-binding protein [Roseomonas hellenica]|uniref:ABC transporter substrate-binding protein n=1 Tax=Plastoroseomonas hellenica TaxID=2687306 RepID=A0ABS5F8X7_9PROT|nr:ABC transporter substrate-binding protein [Plastoroseomonas hellenica]MBR0668580.1 ABC transporter substrate-binding protein [Plastoroseomonas hellenica]